MKTLSIVIPVYNEAENVLILYAKIKEVIEKKGIDCEIIFVDDGSTDKTLGNLKGIIDDRVRTICVRRNFGKARALSKGFSEASGKYIMTMDGDLQDDPEEIPHFLAAITDYEMVSGWKHERKDTFFKIVASRVFNFLVRMITDIKLHDIDCGYKIYRKEIVDNLSLYGGMYRYIPVLVHWEGYSVGEIKVKHNKRKFGRSKYGASRLLWGFLDLLTIKFLINFKHNPLHFFGGIGLVNLLIGFILGSYLIILKFEHIPILSRPLLFLSVLLIILGVQFFSLGLLGELLISKQNK